MLLQEEHVPGRRTLKKDQVNVSRILGIILVLVLLSAGLSLAGKFFFGKDGSFGGSTDSGAVLSSTSSSRSAKKQPGTHGKAQWFASRGSSNAVEEASEQVEPGGQPQQREQRRRPENEEAEDHDQTQPTDSVEIVSIERRTIDTTSALEDVSSVMGKLMIDATPAAYVFNEEDSLGQTPLPFVHPAGTYHLTLVHPDMGTYDVYAEVVAGSERVLRFNLSLLRSR